MAQILEPKRLTFNRYMDLYVWERDGVPAAGEVYLIRINDSDHTFIKIGDGHTEFCDLPAIPNYLFGKSCDNCTHLCKVNRNKLYAVCDEIGKSFFLWQEDTRTNNDCPHFEPKSLNP